MFSTTGMAPESMMDVLLLPLLLTFFGIAARIGAVSYMRTYGKRPNHFLLTYIPLGLAMLIGLSWMYKLYQPDALSREFYAQSLLGVKGRVQKAHYAAFLIPLVATIGIALYDRRQGGVFRAAKK